MLVLSNEGNRARPAFVDVYVPCLLTTPALMLYPACLSQLQLRIMTYF